MKMQIYVVTHKQVELPKNESYIPIVVGNHSVTYDNAVYDNTGENIANKNSNYCELTALYWIWKNRSEDGAYGLCHYRRFFYNKAINGRTFLDTKKISRQLRKHDIILPFPFFWQNTTVEKQLIDTSISQYNFDLIRKAIATLYPEYLSAYHEIFEGHYASYCNMFIMTSKEQLDSYCQWLFDILFYIEKYSDLSNATDYEKRIYGFISERLLNVWVKKNNLRVKYLHVNEGNTKCRPGQDVLDEIQAIGDGVYGNGRFFRCIAKKVYTAIRKILCTIRGT